MSPSPGIEMARYQVIVAYDGTGFHGSQRQGPTRTVQRVLEQALNHCGWKGRSILLAGRTDSGVHASGQVAAFDLDWQHSMEDLQKAINTWLPADMVVKSVRQTAEGFHPRFDAVARSYRYRLFCQETRDPLRERYAWRVWPGVDDLTGLAQIWLGRHDFSAYGSPTSPNGTTERTVLKAGWSCQGDEWIFDIQADAFLYRLIRRLVYVQVAAGQKRVKADDLKMALSDNLEKRMNAKKRIPAGLAVPNGLTLVEVKYDLSS